MYSIEDIFEINLSEGSDSKQIMDDAAATLDSIKKNNVSIKLKLGNTPINQSQMIFIKSLIESFGHKLSFVETTNPSTRDICLNMDINTTNVNFMDNNFKLNDGLNELNNTKLDELRREFKQGLGNSENPVELQNVDELENENCINQDENTEQANQNEPPCEAFRESNISTNQTTETEDETVQKQTIGVYRKANEQQNRLEFGNDDVDFYATPTDEPVVTDTKDTIYVNQTLRNGQVVEYDGNVVIIGDCHPGSEIKATGDITVWGVLGSIAHAGIKGNIDAKIRALKMNAVQLRIANCYSRRPDGGNIPYIVKSSVFTPEEARIVDNNIVLFKMAQD